MLRTVRGGAAVLGVIIGVGLWTPAVSARDEAEAVRPPAPELTHSAATEWINSKPLTLAQLRGRAVLIEFWTFGCINCLRTLPWLKAMHGRYASEGLVIVSVHSPEFDRERDSARVRAAVRAHGIPYAVMLDNDFSYWKALGNRYWPAFYLVDRSGCVTATAIGELHADKPSGERFEKQIRAVLKSRDLQIC